MNQLSTVSPRQSNNKANKISKNDRAVHDWYRFVLSFPPHLVYEYLQKFNIKPGQRILDPFCGTGTTLVEGKKLGVETVGIEANAMAFLASSVKLDWSIDTSMLRKTAERISNEASRILSAQGLGDGSPAISCRNQSCEMLLSLKPDAFKLILSDSISPVPLHRCLVIRNLIEQYSDPCLSNHLRLALARTIVFNASNLHFGPEVGIGPPKIDAPVVSAWLDEIVSMAADIDLMSSQKDIYSQVYHLDSRSQFDSIPDQSIDAVFTSPPYPNEKDYTRTTRLESVILGLINNRQELQAMKRTLLRSNTRNVYKGDDDDHWVKDFPQINEIADQIEKRRIELGKTSGFERMYARVTKQYFGGMARHLAEMRRVLKPGAMLGYVVGDQASYLRVMIRTGHLLADIAAKLGYDVVGIDLFRTRLATATKEQLREEVVVLRWLG